VLVLSALSHDYEARGLAGEGRGTVAGGQIVAGRPAKSQFSPTILPRASGNCCQMCKIVYSSRPPMSTVARTKANTRKTRENTLLTCCQIIILLASSAGQ